MAIDLIEEISEIKFKLDDLIMDPDKRKAMPDEVRRLLAEAVFKLDQIYLELYGEEEPQELALGAHA